VGVLNNANRALGQLQETNGAEPKVKKTSRDPGLRNKIGASAGRIAETGASEADAAAHGFGFWENVFATLNPAERYNGAVDGFSRSMENVEGASNDAQDYWIRHGEPWEPRWAPWPPP